MEVTIVSYHPESKSLEPPEPELRRINLRTFADYGPDFGWFAHCTGCARDRDFTLAELGQHFGLDADVDDVRRRLRCARCGQQKALLYRYYRGGMHGPGEHAYR